MSVQIGGRNTSMDPTGVAISLLPDAQLLGRLTYEGFAAAWPNMGGDEFSRKMNEMPKYVVSSTLTEAAWTNSTVIGTDLAAAIPTLQPAG